MTSADLLLLICRICELLKPEATWTEKLLVASVILEAEKRAKTFTAPERTETREGMTA